MYFGSVHNFGFLGFSYFPLFVVTCKGSFLLGGSPEAPSVVAPWQQEDASTTSEHSSSSGSVSSSSPRLGGFAPPLGTPDGCTKPCALAWMLAKLPKEVSDCRGSGAFKGWLDGPTVAPRNDSPTGS